MSDIIAEMSKRQLDLVEMFEEHLDIVRKMDDKTDKLVAELPRLRWVAYGSLVISLMCTLFVGWALIKLYPLLVARDVPALRP
jgi:hypothetical protein